MMFVSLPEFLKTLRIYSNCTEGKHQDHECVISDYGPLLPAKHTLYTIRLNWLSSRQHTASWPCWILGLSRPDIHPSTVFFHPKKNDQPPPPFFLPPSHQVLEFLVEFPCPVLQNKHQGAFKTRQSPTVYLSGKVPQQSSRDPAHRPQPSPIIDEPTRDGLAPTPMHNT